MKKLKELLRIPEEGEISDKTFMARMILGIVGIIVCLIALAAITIMLFGGLPAAK
ncbi:MAG: hypothetical protein ACI4RP_08675 [Acutalibacteraceae bacterium]